VRGTPAEKRAKRVALLDRLIKNRWDLSAWGLIGQLMDDEAKEREPLALAMIVRLAKHGKYKRARNSLTELAHILKGHELRLAALLQIYWHSHAAVDRRAIEGYLEGYLKEIQGNHLAWLLVCGISGKYVL